MKSNGFKKYLGIISFMVFLFAAVLPAQAVSEYTPENDDVLIMTLGEMKAAGIPLTDNLFIPGGEALDDDDIFMVNREMAIAIAVGSPNPWGYPVSSILDVAVMNGDVGEKTILEALQDGDVEASTDTIWDMEFLMNNWDSWSPSNSQPSSIVVSDNIDFDGDGVLDGIKGIVATRQFSEAVTTDAPMTVVTNYVLSNEDNFLNINTIVSNPLEGATYDELSTGYSLGNKGAYMFVADESVGEPYNRYFSTYNSDYNVSLIDLEADDTDLWGSPGYKDTARYTTYEPGDTYNFEAILRIDAEGSLEGTLNQLMDLVGAEQVTVSGLVEDELTKEIVADPILVVEKNGQTFSWIIGEEDGSFSFDLPAEDDMSVYQIYALKTLYSPSEKASLIVDGEGYTTGTLLMAETESLTVTVKDGDGESIDARIQVLDVTVPAVRYVAQTVFYTDLEDVGVVEIPVASGDYRLNVSNAAKFEAVPTIATGNTEDSGEIDVVVEKLIDPAAENWRSGDLHHHSNKSDGNTLPLDLVKSQLAAGLDVLFTSDHDAVSNNPEVYAYGEARDIPFIPSIEISPSYAHFNVLPIESYFWEDMKDGNFSMNPYTPFPDIVDQVHELGGAVIANHSFDSYGMFTARDNNAIPGGYSSDFDLIEINGDIKASYNWQAVEQAMTFWTASIDNGGKIYYLTGGSDTHDVLQPDIVDKPFSGKCRTMIYLEDEVTPANFVETVLAGHAYATMGPIILADNIFGETEKIQKGESYTLEFDVQSVTGIEKVEIYTRGNEVAASESFEIPSTDRESFSFELTPGEDTWYNIVVTDSNEQKAVSNPVWIDFYGDDSSNNNGAGGIAFKANARSMAYVSGYPNGTFQPNKAVSRAEAVAMLYELISVKDIDTKDVFADVPEGMWAVQAIEALANAGVVGGYPDGTFKPNKAMTRAEFANLVCGILSLESDGVGSFKDTKGHWAENSISKMAAAGYIIGYDDGNFRPNQPITRAEEVTLINRIIGSTGGSNVDISPFKDLTPKHWAFVEIMKAMGK